MGCVSSKVLAKSGSFQEQGSLGQSFKTSNVIEEIILSSSKSNGDQFLALLRASSNSTARKAKEPEPEQSPVAAAVAAVAEPAAMIETINVSELLAGLEEENAVEQEQRDRKDGDTSPAQCVSDGAAAAGRARSFRTVEEFDALVTQSGSSERERAAAEREEPRTAAAATTAEAAAESSGTPGHGEAGEGAAGAKRRARARQLGELKVPGAFDFSKSGSLRDWLRQGGQIFSPGSYVTPKFGTAPAAPPAERGGGEKPRREHHHQQEHEHEHEREHEHEHALFDPELVAQFERAMEQLSEDEGRALDEILEALEQEAGEKDGAAAFGRVSNDQPAAVAVQQV